MLDLKSQTFIGIVEDNKDPKKSGRCRVRVVNIFDQIPKDDIPWATPWKDLNGNSFMVPEVGKIVTVIFDQGNIYKPEFIYSEHYNVNLESKINSLSQNSNDSKKLDDYTSMKALLYDHNTQIYVNESEGLKIDHKYNNIHIEENSITLNLKDKNATLNLGDASTDQPIILGKNFLEWFDDFLNILITNGYFSSSPGSPCVPQPNLFDHVTKYFLKRDPYFLSHHIKAVDNQMINTVINTSGSFPVHRQNYGQAGDVLKAVKQPALPGTPELPGLPASLSGIINLAKRLKDAPRPSKKRKKRFDAKYKSPQEKQPIDGVTNQQGLPQSTAPVQNVQNPDNSKQSDGIGNTFNSPATSQDYNKVNPNKVVETYEDEDDTSKLVRYLENKSGSSPVTGRTEDYIIYEEPYIMNIIAFRNRVHEYGKVTNRFDDELWVFYKDEKNQWQTIRRFSVTTMPGYKVVDGKKIDPPVLPENVGFANYGQYVNSYKLGFHNPDDYGKRHPALVCDKVGIRMNKKKGVYSTDRYVNTVLNTQSGIDIDGWVYGTGINIHCAISLDESVYGDGDFSKAGIIYDEVNNWSMGCIVFNNPNQYREFLGLCEEQKTKGKKSQFTLTVASLREFELFETDSFVEDESNEILGDLDDRFPDFEGEENY